MTAYTEIRARIDPDTKTRAAKALNERGLSLADGVRQSLMMIAEGERLPTALEIPNQTTLDAMKELEMGGGKRFDSIDALMEDLKA